MTLSTNVFIQGDIEAQTVFHYCRSLLGATDIHPWTDEDSRGWPGDRMLSNEIGIGLPALLMLSYRSGSPLREDGDACSDSCDPEDDYHHHDPAHWINVDFDTGYGYHDLYGGCGALHARLVFQLGQWLDEREIPWCWQNEFTGEIHGGDDRYRRLADLTTGGQAAMRWFKGTVEPAIEAGLGR